ncbi:MAM and LDL-receptor class A domain-containing protein 2-like isoform X2 [Mytilus edulis]|uniref:MAM and LDL-receptor class A domain-containing protein 2-like isoform X2 n=1 Tax=Mytilus edulis TaxID=6550 RepID=UPI0039EF5A0A
MTENSILSFWYHMNGNGIGSLNVYLVSKHTRLRIWQKTRRQSPDWLLANIPVSPGISKIEFEATAKYHYGSDLAIDDIALTTASPSSLWTTTTTSPSTVTVASLPIHCNFEDGLCGFHTDNKKFPSVSWSSKSGTESLGSYIYLRGDNTTGTGSYLSLTIDEKTALSGDKANLYLPAIRTRNMTCLTFAYSLPSHTSGSLQVFETDTNTGTATLIRQVSDYHGPNWKSTFVQFLPSADPLEIVIEGSYTGEPGCIVTIDDIHLEEGICDGYVQSTTTTTTTRPTTPTLPAIYTKEMESCQSEYGDLLNELSCDFTDDFCKYSKNDSPVHWQRKQGADGIVWLGQIPKRNTTLSGYYIKLNLSTWQVRHGEGILKTPDISLTSVCVEFVYSMPGRTSNIKVEIETSLGQVKTIWSKNGTINAGKWNKQALVINYYENFKVLFSATKMNEKSFAGIDDIHIYGKSQVTSSRSVTNTASSTYLTAPFTKDTGLITTTPQQGSHRTTKQMLTSAIAHQTHISTNLKTTLNKTSSTKRPLSSSTLYSTLITTGSATHSPLNRNLTSPSNTDIGLKTSTPNVGIKTSTRQISIPTTVQQTHTSTDLKSTENKTSSSEQPLSSSTIQSTLISTPSSESTDAPVPKSTTPATTIISNLKTSHTGQTTTPYIKKPSKHTTVHQTHFSTTSSHTEKNTPSTSYSTSSKHMTKKKTTTDAKKTTLNKHDSKTTDHSTTPYIIQVTKKTFTTKKNKATKSEADKSDYISKGAQAGIGITVALLGVGLVVAVLFIMKKKISTIDQGIKLNKNEIQLESKYTKTETYINGDTKNVIENGVSQANNQTAWTSTEP